MKLLLLIASPVLAVTAFVVFVGAVLHPASTFTTLAPLPATGCGVTGRAAGLTAEQQTNAAAIATTALNLGLGPQGATVGIVAALTESSLVNVPFGDRSSNGQMTTSRGLFQQKSEWGPLTTRMDPAGAAGLFFTGGQAGQRGLTQIPGWQTLPIPAAAQSVQGSAFASGSNYERNLARGTTIVNALIACTTPVTPSGTAPGAVPQMNRSQDPSTFGWVRAAGQVPFTWGGLNFGLVASGTEALWTAVLNELAPLIPGGIHQGACFSDRQNVNNPTRASFHAFGLACDLNWAENGNGHDPAGLQGGRFVLPMTTGTIAAKYGMEWGGEFRGTKDPMHLEIHLTPTQVAIFGRV